MLDYLWPKFAASIDYMLHTFMELYRFTSIDNLALLPIRNWNADRSNKRNTMYGKSYWSGFIFTVGHIYISCIKGIYSVAELIVSNWSGTHSRSAFPKPSACCWSFQHLPDCTRKRGVVCLTDYWGSGDLSRSRFSDNSLYSSTKFCWSTLHWMLRCIYICETWIWSNF